MTGFIASPPEPASPAGAKVEAGPFWPDIDLNTARDIVRIGSSTIPDARLIAAVEGAIISVDNDLADWRAVQEDAGFTTLAGVSDRQINGKPRLAVLWQRAVLATATADLMETHRDVTATKEGAARAEEILPTADDHRRNAVQAVRDIKGKRRITSELI